MSPDIAKTVATFESLIPMRIIGIGTDITECERIARMLERHPESFVERVFTDAENAYCSRGKRQSVEHYTGRWAAKEAVLKALGTGWSSGITWRDVEILNEPGGKPFVRLTGAAAEIAHEKGIAEIQISISHCVSHAVAFAVAIGQDS
jgi:holo-[acyl-carrier protein] synthase